MSFINRLTAIQKIMISIGMAALLYGLLGGMVAKELLRALLSWDVFCLTFLVLTWITFFTTRAIDIRKEARIQKEGRVAVFIIAIIATLAAMMALVLLLVNRKEGYHDASLPLVTAFAGMILSWSLVHTVFAMRYAYIFYADHREKKDQHAGGLDFPEEQHPDFLDFAYFSFVIGMTFQVSDVTISARLLRRLVLLHSLIAFTFNTVVVAMTVNVIAGLS